MGVKNNIDLNPGTGGLIDQNIPINLIPPNQLRN